MFLFYIDESGTPGKKVPSVEEQHLTLLALGVHEFTWRRLDRAIKSIKESYFPSRHWHDIVIHSTDMRRGNSPFDPASISPTKLKALVDDIYGLFQQGQVVLIAVTVDKKLYEAGQYGPVYIKAFELLLERIELYMREHRLARSRANQRQDKTQAMVIVEARMANQNDDLLRAFESFQRSGTSAGSRLQTVVEYPLFVAKNNCNVMQLADLAAYNVRRNEIDKVRGSEVEYPFFTKIHPCFYRSANTASDKVDGLKYFP